MAFLSIKKVIGGVFFALAVVGAELCTPECSDEFVNRCVPFNNQGYNACRQQLDNDSPPLKNAGCVPSCDDTDAMAATKESPQPNDDLVDCSSGKQTLVANEKGSPQDLCGIQLCDTFSERGADKCAVSMDVPSLCEGDAGMSCPIAFFFHGAGGTNSMWPNTNKDVIHDGSNNFIGIYPNGVDNQWNTGSQTGSVSEVDDISFTLSIIDVLKANFDWEGRFYAYGHSNGAAMANKIAVNGVGFSGIAASASQLIQTPTSSTAPSGSSYLLNSLPNEKATKIAMLSMHGDADGTIPYDGGDLFDTGYVLMSESESQRNYAILNGCGASADTPVETTVEAVIGSGAASTAIKRVFVGCDVTSYQVVGGNHDVANSIAGDSLTKIGIDFFAGIESKLPESSDNSNTVDSDSGADSGVGVFATTHLCATLFLAIMILI